jgi:hypothetical protein
MLGFLLAAALEIPLRNEGGVPVATATTLTAVAPAADAILAVWGDSRELGAIYATRLTTRGAPIDSEPIRLVPPPHAKSESFMTYGAPAVAFAGDSWVVAYERNTIHAHGPVSGADFRWPEIVLTRIRSDGSVLDGEPRIVGTGLAPMIAANGTTLLLTWNTPGATRETRLLTRDLQPIATVMLPAGRIPSVVPRVKGYLVLTIADGTGAALSTSISDDGTTGEPAGLGFVQSLAATAMNDGALVVRTGASRLTDVVLDASGRVVAEHDLIACGGDVRGVAQSGRGFLALVNCEDPITPVTMPPPLPQTHLFTIAIDPQGSFGGVRHITDRPAFGVFAAGDQLYTTLGDRTANIVPLTYGSLSPPIVLSLGATEQLPVALLPLKGGALAFWRGGGDAVTQESWALRAMTLNIHGADPAVRPRTVAPFGYDAATNGSTIAVLDVESRTRVVRLISVDDGRTLASLPIPADTVKSDGRHWLFSNSSPPGGIIRTDAKGGSREVVPIDSGQRSAIACNDRGCLRYWTDNGTGWGVLIRADAPLKDARRSRVADDATQTPVVAAGAGGFLAVTSNASGELRAVIVSNAGRVSHDVLLATYDPMRVPYVCAGGGEDGFEVVANEPNAMQAFRIDSAGNVSRIGPIGDGEAKFVVRSGAAGYVMYERNHHLFATVTE